MPRTEEYHKDGKMPGAHQLLLQGAGGEGGLQLVPLKFYPHRRELARVFLRESLQGREGELEERWWGGHKWLVNVRAWADYVLPSADHGISAAIDRFLRVDEGANRRRLRNGKREVPLGDTLFG